LIVSTGLVEGAAIALMFLSAGNAQAMWMVPLFILLIAARLWNWYAYRDGLRRAQAPGGTLQVLSKLHREFMITGCVLPVLLAVIPVAAGRAPWGILLAGALALIAGWRLKYALVTKAAYKQGYGIGKLRKGRPVIKTPVRRDGDPVQL
jgi:phenylacetyl-CoA:acceptor oxidoreductase subunit 2